MSKTAFIYPGQGAQKAGMGADFYENSEIARYIFDQAGEELGLDMKALCFEENDKLDLTEYTQAAMVTTCLAMTRVAENKGLKADVTAGLSLGEYPAIAIAGGMNDMDAIRLVRKRGILMQNTVPAGEGAMCAVISMDAEKIEEVIEPIADVSVANYNCPGQIVIGGEVAAVDKAAEVALELKAKRVVPLNVSGPFHTSLLEPASKKLAEKLNQVSFGNMNIPVVFNTTAKELQPDETISGLLTKQIMSSVYLEDSIRYMIDRGIDTFLEIGPGKVLSGFIKKISKDVSIYQVEDVASLTKTLESIKE